MSDLYWQFGICGLSFGCSTDDGFTIFLNDTAQSRSLVYEHAEEVNAEDARLSQQGGWFF